jgi:glycosyltransferase involved in cell wall biosynthesis
LIGEFQELGLALYLPETWKKWASLAVVDWKNNHQVDRWDPLLMTCILISHRKPKYVHEAIASVLAQDSPDWQLVINDSGSLFHELKRYEADPRIKVIQSPHGDRCQGWQINEVVLQGLVRGDLLCYLSDDDVYSPNAFAIFLDQARFWPNQRAWYASVERTALKEAGEERIATLEARLQGGIGGESLDCVADGMQVCHRADLFVPWPEDRAVAWHADGLFLQALGKRETIYPLPVVIGRHRHTAASEFTRPSLLSPFPLG